MKTLSGGTGPCDRSVIQAGRGPEREVLDRTAGSP
jgi:hypothetical protein